MNVAPTIKIKYLTAKEIIEFKELTEKRIKGFERGIATAKETLQMCPKARGQKAFIRNLTKLIELQRKIIKKATQLAEYAENKDKLHWMEWDAFGNLQIEFLELVNEQLPALYKKAFKGFNKAPKI